MGPHPRRYFHVNRWLAELGLLTPRARRAGLGVGEILQRLKERIPRRWRALLRKGLPQIAQEQVFRALLNVGQVDWMRTHAYRVPLFPMVDGIEVNVRGRQPEGTVAAGGDYEALRDLLLTELRALRDPETGEAVVEEAWRREEVYSGPHTEEAPDILVLYRSDYTGGLGLHGPLVSPYDESLNHWSGTHRMDGVFIAHGPLVRPNARPEGARIIDAAPTILYALGLPVPEDMDGRPLLEIFREEVACRPQERGRGLAIAAARAALSPDEEEKINAQLRGLGYL